MDGNKEAGLLFGHFQTRSSFSQTYTQHSYLYNNTLMTINVIIKSC